MSKRYREEDTGRASVEELCRSVKRLHTLVPEFCSADQNRLPFEDPLKPQLPLVEPQFQSVQQFQQFQHRQSLENLATLPLDTLAHSEHQSMSEYEQANMMLRDLHFERVQRQQQ